MRLLVRFLRLSNRDKALFCICLKQVAFYATVLAFMPYSEAERRWPVSVRKQVRAINIRNMAWFITAAARLVPGATCLPQALAGRAILASAGREASIRIGVAPAKAGRFEAHAWLICEETVILGGGPEDIARYTPLTDLGAKVR